MAKKIIMGKKTAVLTPFSEIEPTKKKEVVVEETHVVSQFNCDNCEDSGLRCMACGTR